MSQPNFPIIDPPLTRDGSVNEIISSIAAEELSLSHILNAEGEKLQYVLGTLPGLSGGADIEDVLDVNRSVQRMLDEVAQQQLLMGAKLSAALDVPVFTGPTGPTGPAGTAATATAAYLANTSVQTVNVLTGGAAISMSDIVQNSPDISVLNGKELTVNTPGRYLISYNVNTSLPSNAGARLMINGTANEASVIAPSAIVPKSHFSAEIIVELTAKSTVSLQMFGILASIALLPGSGSANLSVIRLS